MAYGVLVKGMKFHVQLNCVMLSMLYQHVIFISGFVDSIPLTLLQIIT